MVTTNTEGSGFLLEATSTKNFDKINNLVMDDTRIKVRSITCAVDISSELVHNILHNISICQRRNRMICSKNRS